MNIQGFFDNLKRFELLDSVELQDFGDRLVHRLGPIVLIVCSLAMGAKEYFGKPIFCFQPIAPSKSSYMNSASAEQMCWIKGVQPYSEPYRKYDSDAPVITYYLWVPLMLAVQSLLLYAPKLLFDLLTFSRMPANVNFAAKAAKEASLMDRKKRLEQAHKLAEYLRDLLIVTSEYREGFIVKLRLRLNRRVGSFCCFGKRLGFYLLPLYLMAKAFAIVLIFLTIEMMREFLSLDTLWFGADLLRNLTNGVDWRTTHILPRFGLCRLALPSNSRAPHRTDLYCVISGNMFVEKIYIFLWFFYTLLGLVNTICLLTWLKRLAFSTCRRSFLRKFLQLAPSSAAALNLTANQLHQFESNCLRVDGVFLLWAIRLNSGELVTADIVRCLYTTCKNSGFNLNAIRVDDNDESDVVVTGDNEKQNETRNRRQSHIVYC